MNVHVLVYHNSIENWIELKTLKCSQLTTGYLTQLQGAKEEKLHISTEDSTYVHVLYVHCTLQFQLSIITVQVELQGGVLMMYDDITTKFILSKYK